MQHFSEALGLQETPVEKNMTNDTLGMKSAKSRMRKTLKGN